MQMSLFITTQVFKVSHLRNSAEMVHGYRQNEDSIWRKRIVLLKQSVIHLCKYETFKTCIIAGASSTAKVIARKMPWMRNELSSYFYFPLMKDIHVLAGKSFTRCAICGTIVFVEIFAWKNMNLFHKIIFQLRKIIFHAVFEYFYLLFYM